MKEIEGQIKELEFEPSVESGVEPSTPPLLSKRQMKFLKKGKSKNLPPDVMKYIDMMEQFQKLKSEPEPKQKKRQRVNRATLHAKMNK